MHHVKCRCHMDFPHERECYFDDLIHKHKDCQNISVITCQHHNVLQNAWNQIQLLTGNNEFSDLHSQYRHYQMSQNNRTKKFKIMKSENAYVSKNYESCSQQLFKQLSSIQAYSTYFIKIDEPLAILYLSKSKIKSKKLQKGPTR